VKAYVLLWCSRLLTIRAQLGGLFDDVVDTAAFVNGQDQAAVAHAAVSMLQFRVVALQIRWQWVICECVCAWRMRFCTQMIPHLLYLSQMFPHIFLLALCRNLKNSIILCNVSGQRGHAKVWYATCWVW